MATLSIDVPDALIPDLTQALALRMQGTTDATVTPIITKMLLGQATTAAEKQTLARTFMKEEAKRALLDWRAQQAAVVSRTNDPTAMNW